MKKLNLVLLFGSFLSITSVIAQQEPHFTQYFDNMLHVNPGYAGSNDALSLTALHREQWVGFAGRPRTSTFIIHSPLAKNIGGGFSFIHDEIGPLNQTMLSGDLSYTLRFKKSNFSLFPEYPPLIKADKLGSAFVFSSFNNNSFARLSLAAIL